MARRAVLSVGEGALNLLFLPLLFIWAAFIMNAPYYADGDTAIGALALALIASAVTLGAWMLL